MTRSSIEEIVSSMSVQPDSSRRMRRSLGRRRCRVVTPPVSTKGLETFRHVQASAGANVPGLRTFPLCDAYRGRVRRCVAVIGLTVACLALLAQSAWATFHLEMVNEVMLGSSSGDANVQFVELLDHGGSEEEFTPVCAPYKLVIYDAAGNKLGEHMLDPSGLRSAAAADGEYLISTSAADAAFGVTGNERLDVSLPPGAGQACFQANPNPPAFSCMTWGSISKPVATNSMGTGSVNGPVPANGQSDQRLQDNSVVAATPTPKARNSATGAGGGGGGGGGSTVFAGLGFAATKASVDRHGRASIALSCPASSGGCSGKITLTRGSKSAKTTKLGSAQFSVAAGKTRKVKVK